MLATGELELAFPGTGAPAFGDRPSLRRTLAAVRAWRGSRRAGGRGARLPHDGGVPRLVHVRTYDRPVRCAGWFCPETAGDAAAGLDKALLAAPTRRPPGYLAVQIRTCPAGVYGGI